MGFFTGLFNSTTSLIARLVTAAIVGVLIWFLVDLAVDYGFNFLASYDVRQTVDKPYSSATPTVLYVQIGLIVLSRWLLVVRSKVR